MREKNDGFEFFIAKENLLTAIDTLQTFYNSKLHPVIFRKIKNSPYSFSTKQHFILRASITLNKPLPGTKKSCKICDKSVDHEKMRSHVDQHFILEECDIAVNLCGYCGLSMTSEFCKSSLGLYVSSGSKTKGTKKPQSECPYFYPFSMGCTLNCSDINPSSNRQVECELCQTKKIFWSNNMILHYEQEHSGTECPFTKTEEEIKKLTDYKH